MDSVQTLDELGVLFENVAFPWPPSVNDFYGKRVIGKLGKQFVGVYLTKKAKTFITNVTATVYQQGLNLKTPHRLRMTAVTCAPTRRKYDISNYVKLLEDSLEQAGVYLNDNQIDEWVLRRGKIMKPGFIFITCEIIALAD